ETPTTDPDVEKNKGLAILAYILFVIPLIAAPQSKFVRFHANQGLMVFIVWMVVLIVCAALGGGKFLIGTMEVKWFLTMFCGCAANVIPALMALGATALMIFGIINAANGEKKTLPLIGQWKLIK
ncbi:MAG: hypothetical protein FWD53_11290, partial [Phycisphaerales bacterium]|nr:hypothetical protein [Phycisphaerales bacterium]